MRRRRRRSRPAARPSSANGGSSIALSPIAWRKQATVCSPSPACRQASGAAHEQRMRSSGCTRNSNEGSRLRPCCRRQIRPRCCSGRCSLPARSTCAKWMDGRRWPQSPSISQLTSQPETIPSCYRRSRQPEFQPHSGRHPNKDTQTVISALIKQAKKLPSELYKSLTWDRGKELTDHRRFTLATNIDVYFCDPQSPWQRGSNENTNGLLRRYFPKGTDLSVHSQAHLNKVARQLNERPRQTLQFETPADRLQAVLH